MPDHREREQKYRKNVTRMAKPGTMKRTVSFLLILMTLALFFNNAGNWHFHKLPNGIVVEHAHPYAKFPTSETPFEDHQHSDLEYLILDTVYHGALVVLVAFALFLPYREKKTRNHLMPVPVTGSHYSRLPFLRAPPSS
jgi:hypothetical protein